MTLNLSKLFHDQRVGTNSVLKYIPTKRMQNRLDYDIEGSGPIPGLHELIVIVVTCKSQYLTIPTRQAYNFVTSLL